MKDRTELLTQKIEPAYVLVTYQVKNRYYSSQIVPYMETRPVLKNGELGPAKPVSHAFVSSLADMFGTTGRSIPHGNVPSNMLYIDTRTENYVWYNPPQRRMMYFNDVIPLKDQEYNMPGFIYVVNKDKLRVFSFKGKKPNAKSRLIHAPAFNTTDGRVCLGGAAGDAGKPSDLTWNNFLKWWEGKFWNSINSHLGNNPTKGNLTLLIKESADKPFDCSQLLNVNMNLETLLRSV